MRGRELARVRRVLVTIAILCGCGVAMVAGGAPLIIGGLTALFTLAGRLITKPPSPASLARWRLASWLAFGGFIAASVLPGVPVVIVAVALVGWLQVHRAWVGKTAADDRLALLLALLHFLVSCILTINPLLGPLFLLFVLTATPGMLLCHLGTISEAETRPLDVEPLSRRRLAVYVAAIGPVAMLLSLGFFLAIPRVEAGNLMAQDRGNSLSGFGRDVQLGDVGEIKDNPAVALRLEVTDGNGDLVEGPFYLRGAVLDQFDGTKWVSSVGGARRPRSAGDADPSRTYIQKIMLEPIGQEVIFGLPMLSEVRDLDGIVTRDANGEWNLGGSEGRIAYTAVSVAPESDPTRLAEAVPAPKASALTRNETAAAEAGVWLQLPEDLDPRVARLARQIADQAGTNPYERARAIEHYLRTELDYTVVPEESGLRQPLSGFLFDTRRGHCEYFATALTVMLRTLGIPARVVNGFYGGDWNQFGGYWVFRQSDAHSWVEVNFGEAGWVYFDATPEGLGGLRPETTSWLSEAVDVLIADWYEIVLDYDLSTQLDFVDSVAVSLRVVSPQASRTPGLGGLEESWPVMVVVGVLGVVFVGFRTFLSWLAGERGTTRIPTGRLARIHHRVRRRIVRRGWEIPDSLPPLEASQWLIVRAGPSAKPLEELAWLLYRVRYAGETEEGLVPVARDAARRLKALPRRRRRG